MDGRLKKDKTIDSLDSLALLAQNCRECGAPLERTYAIDSKILAFAQKTKTIKYRQMRAILKKVTQYDKIEKDFIDELTKHLEIEKDHAWSRLNPLTKTDDPIIFPFSHSSKKKINYKQIINNLLRKNKPLKEKYTFLSKISTEKFNAIEPVYILIEELYAQGLLESSIVNFKKIIINKKTKISKSFMSSLMHPQKAEIIKQEGELPNLTLGERQALQFLMWKIENMNEREKHLKYNWILEGQKEDHKKNGVLVVFELSEALEKTYGEDLRFCGRDYQNLQSSLFSLLEKQRKLLIEKKNETLELSISFLQKIEMQHKFRKDPEFKKYIAAWIPWDIVKIHDKLYTTYPSHHFAMLRKTPPETRLNEMEVLFFDFLYSESPHKKNEEKIVRRRKNSFLIFIGGEEIAKHRLFSRLAQRIESKYVKKAINLGLLKDFKIETNKDNEQIYVFVFQEKT